MQRGRADVRLTGVKADVALSRLEALSAVVRATEKDAAGASLGVLVRTLGYRGFALVILPNERIVSSGWGLVLGEGAVRAALEASLRANPGPGDPVVRRLATTGDGFTLERYLRRPVDPERGGTLSAVIATFAAHGLCNVAMTPVAGPIGAAPCALALAGPNELDADAFAALFAETGWLAALAASAVLVRHHAPTPASDCRLTASETSVVLDLARGLRPREIAARLGKSERTVRNQVDSAKRRLGVETSAGLVAEALRLELIRI